MNPIIELQLAKNWPEQIIVDHEPFWRAWRKTTSTRSPRAEKDLVAIGRNWCAFANGKNLNPTLMYDWIEFAKNKPSKKRPGSPISNLYVVRYRGHVRSYLRWLHLMGAIEKDPGDCLPRVKADPPGPKLIFTHEEYLRMTAYGREHGQWNTELWLVMLGYHTGLSLVDCCTLTWSEVHLPDDGPCFIRRIRAKMESRCGTKAMCTVPIIVGHELWVWLKQLKRRHEEESKFDRPDNIDYVYQAAADMAEESTQVATIKTIEFFKAALGEDRKNRTFRHLRNTFASRLINAGTDAVLVSKMTGHQDVNQLADYVVPDQESMQAAVLAGLRFVEGATKLPEEVPQEGQSCS